MKFNWKTALGVAAAVTGVLSGPAGAAFLGAKAAGIVTLAGSLLAAVNGEIHKGDTAAQPNQQ